MSTYEIASELEKSVTNFGRLAPNFEALIDQLSEGAENYEKALMNIDNGAEHTDKTVISTDETLQNADKSFKATLLQKEYFTRIHEVLREVKDGVRNGTINSKNASDTLSAKFKEASKEHEILAKERNFIQDENYKEFRDRVWKCRNPDDDFLSDGDQNADEEEDEDGIRMLRQDVDVKCPLSGEVIDIAYVTSCNHYYSATIFDYIKQGKGQMRCAVVGCSNGIKQADVKVDKKRTKEIKKRLRQMKEQERVGVDEIEIDF